MKNALRDMIFVHPVKSHLRLLVLLLVGVPVVCPTGAFAQNPRPGGETARSDTDSAARKSFMDTIIDDLNIVGRDWLAYNTAPLRFSPNAWIEFGGVVGGTAGLMALDERARDVMLSNQQSDLYAASVDLAWTGDLIAADIASGLVYLSGLFSRNEDLRVTGRMMGQSLIYAGTVALVLRFLTGRRWPAAKEGAFSFDTWPPDNTYHAFPSGHSVVVFSLATILAERINSWPVTVLLFGTAVASGLGRMYIDQHWASDVFLGAVLGFTTGRFVLSREAERYSRDRDGSNWTLTPTVSGMLFTLRF